MDLYKSMEEKKFIGRTNELSLLKKALERKGSELIILYGRRRVGKTRLLQELSKQIKIDVSIMLEETDYITNLRKVAYAIAERFGFPSFSPTSFRDAFSQLPERTTIILDEFSYLGSASAEFQAIWEEVAKKKEVKIILCGSFIRIMEDLAFSMKSPLYGRATEVIKLMPLSFDEVCMWYKGAKIEDIIRVYFAVGGIPRYLELVEKPGEKFLEDAFFSQNSILLREGKLLLKEAFPASTVFPRIMFAIASGETEATKIANKSDLHGAEVSKYLSILEDYGFVRKRFPVLGGGKKDVRFFIADRFFGFWVLFVQPFYGEIEAGNTDNALSDFEKKKKYFYGREFESLVEELFLRRKEFIPFSAKKVGKQWWKKQKETYEIDVVCSNEETKEILFCECKWEEKVKPIPVLLALENKMRNLDWQESKRKESIVLFAKSFTEKPKKWNSIPVQCFDMKDV